MKGRSARMRRWASAAIAALLLGAILLIGSQTSALDLNPCNNTDAPIPASPYGDGSLGIKIGDADAEADADPFESPDEVTLESVYGTAPQLWTYDNGCTGQFIAGAGTALGNILLQISGLLPNWTHALLEATVSPESPVRALDNPVVDATNAVTDAVWKPWLSVVLLIVVVVILNRARSGRLANSLHAAAWAGLVLVSTSWMISYPTESVKLVDDGVRLAVTNIAFGFDDRSGGDDADPAVAAVAGQMDEIVRSTQYRAWLTGAFGDPDSETAKVHGADLFRATHFTFTEYDTYRKDPEGKGKEVLEDKQEAFKELAEKIERDDPRAYDYFKGEHWSQRATTGLINLVLVAVTCGFLLAAGLAILMSFVLIRLLVPFAPAAGTLFMIDHTRDMAVSWLRRVVGPLVMGPILFLLALVLLRFFTAVLSAPEIWYVAKFAIIAVLTAIAWWAVKPAAYGIGHLRTAAGTARGFATGWRRTVTPYVAPANQVQEPPGISPPPRPPPAAPGMVYMPSALPVPSEHTDLEERPFIGPRERRRASAAYPAPTPSQWIAMQQLGARTKFQDSGHEPNTAYEVPGRGVFYTDAAGNVTHVETIYGGRKHPNPDLNDPAPNATYVVNDRHVFVTDELARTSEAHDPDVMRGEAFRSQSIQAEVGRSGGEGYDGGHLLQNATEGGRERINIVAMMEELNRSGSADYGRVLNNYYDMEKGIRDAVDTGHDVALSLYVDYNDDTSRPSKITAEQDTDGVLERQEFRNVRRRRRAASSPDDPPG